MRLRVNGQVERGQFSLAVDVDLEIDGVTALVGASGAGKSTMLRLIGGFEPDARATVEVDGERWQSADGLGRTLPPHARSVATVFQDSRLFPHLNVQRNLDFASRAPARPGVRLSFAEVVRFLDLEGLLAHYPHQLSGGQRQRVALGRALLAPAKLWLFDEPLASLDPPSRREIAPYLHRLCRRHAVPIIYVSHSLPEVLSLADRVLLAAGGRVGLVDSLAAFSTSFDNPLLGDEAGAVIVCEFKGYDSGYRLSELTFEGASLFVPGDLSSAGTADAETAGAPRRILLHIPARDVSLSTAPVEQVSILNRVHGEVDQVADQGDSMLVRVRCGEQHLLARITRRSADDLRVAAGVRVQALIKSVAVRSGET